jgi:2-polyprenyl-3-methyl-5-hydroxy-6-metoxy-1,4-benzoquinol methylase
MSNYSDSKFSEDTNSSWFKVFNYIDSGTKVLDIGCSSGNFGKVLIDKKKCVVDGIEPDQADFDEARKKLRNVYQLNVETDDLSLIDDRYDFIYFGDVIEHLVHPVETLRRVRTLLKEDGAIVFSIPNMSHLSVRLMLLGGKFMYGETGLLDKTHLHFYTHQEVQRVFSEAGYAIVDLDPVLKDYPKEILEEELKAVGLSITQKFIDFAASTEASVYQFVGIARPGAKKNAISKKLDIVSPVDKFQIYLDQTKEYYEAISKNKDEYIAKQDEHVREMEKKLSQKDIELEQIHEDKFYKAAMKFKAIGGKFK